jgi:hypothetical protein
MFGPSLRGQLPGSRRYARNRRVYRPPKRLLQWMVREVRVATVTAVVTVGSYIVEEFPFN